MSAPTPLEVIERATRAAFLVAYDRTAYLDALADGLTSEPDVEPDWNDPDEPGYGGTEPERGETDV